MTADPYPIDGGYCIKRLDDDHCVDVLRHPGEWRLAVTARGYEVHPHDHGQCAIVTAWSYAGENPETGEPRNTYDAYLTALAAARGYDGATEPPGHNRRVIG